MGKYFFFNKTSLRVNTVGLEDVSMVTGKGPEINKDRIVGI
jgi:hypothetical protein